MIGGTDENEPEAQPSARTATPPPPSSPPIAPPSSPPIVPPSSPLPGAGLGRRLLGSIRALALPASPPAAGPKVGLGLLLHLRPDHPLLHPPTPPASPSRSASEDPLEEDAAAARPRADAGPRSPVNRDGIADAAATSGPTNTTFSQWAAKRAPRLLQYLRPAVDTAGDQEPGLVDGRQAEEFRAGDESSPTHVASPPEDESIATEVSTASEEDDPVEDAAERPHAADAGLDSLVNWYIPSDPAAKTAPANTPFRQWASKRAPHLLRPAVDTAGDQESGLVGGQQAKEFRAGDAYVASPSDDEEDESIATDVSSASEEDDPLEDAAERPHAADAEPLQHLRPAMEEDREDDESRVTQVSSASEEEEEADPLDAAKWLHAGADLALEDHDATAGDDQVEKVLQQCTGDQLRVARDDQQVVQQGSVHPRNETTCDIAAEDQEKVGSAENVDAVEGLELVQQDAIDRKGEGTDGTAAEDHDKAGEQCDTYGLGTTENGGAEDDQEAVEQCVTDKEGAAMDDNDVKENEVVGPTVMDGMRVTIDDISAEDQEKKVEQCLTYESETIENDDDVEDQEVVEQGAVYREGLTIDHDDYVEDHKLVEQIIVEGMPAKTYDIAVEDQKKVVEQCEPRATKDEYIVEEKEKVEDQEKKVEQCVTYDSETIKNGDAVEDLEVVEQGIVYREGLIIEHDDHVEDHKAVEQSIIEGMPTSADDIAVEDQKKVVEQCALHEPRATKDEYTVEEKEKVEDEEKKVEQCVTYDSETIKNGDAVEDQEVVEQGVVHREGLIIEHDDYVEDHKAVEQSIIEGMPTSTDDIAVEDQKKVAEQCALHEPRATKDEYTVEEKEKVEDQEKKVEQCVTYDSETIKNGDAVDDQEVVEQGVVYREGLTIDHDDYAEDHKVAAQSIIEGMPTSTDDIAVEDQKKVVEQCAVHEPRATKDGYTVKEKEKVVEQGATDKQCATNMDVAVKDQDKLMKQHIIDNQGKVPMDDIVLKDRDKAAAQYASDAIITYREDDHVEEHNTVGNQSVIDENGRTKDDIDVEEHDYLKEQVIVDNWGTLSDATASEDQKNEAEICNSGEQIADKNLYAVNMKGSMLEQRTGGKQGAAKSDFTVEKHKDVVERVCHEWGALDDDLAMDMAASQSIRGISSSEVVSATSNGSDGGIGKEKIKLPIRYPQRPGKLNCPFYMSKGSCSYGWSCQFHHPPLKAKPDGSWCPSEQGNHGVAEILELNRIGLPIREGARNCTYYMRNGACRYGKHCHFNHPEHVIDAQFYAPTGWEDNALQLEKSSDHTTLDVTLHLKKSSDDATLDDTTQLKKSSDDATLDDTSYSKKSSDHATLDDMAYSKKSSDHATLDKTSSCSEVLPPNIFRMLLPPQKVLPSTEGKVKKDSEWSSTSDDSDGRCSADSSDGPLCKQEPVHSSDGPLCKQEHVDYPERPGRPECPFYMRFGDCKFASACKYHHSKDKYPTRYHREVPSLGEVQTEYPEIPGEPECPFYMKNRFCKFGAQCRFNHPKDSSLTAESPTNAKKSVATYEHHQSTRIAVEDHVPQQQQYPERPGQPDCRYYLQFGKCKFMSACIFHHPRDEIPVGSNPSGPAHSDQIGPETHDMPECPFYMKTGKCQFGSACEFHHPKDICSTTEGEFGHKTDLACDNFTRPENTVQTQEQIMYPERPGEPRCYNYMRHGSCRFQMNCKYHHPADRLSRKQYGSTYH